MVMNERDRIDHRINFRSSLSFVDHLRFQEDPKGNGMLDVIKEWRIVMILADESSIVRLNDE